jgi:hypothetical protein
MSSRTLNEQFIGNLRTQQRDLIWEYYSLIVAVDKPPNEEAEKIAQIWECAEDDQIICKWLELIDYFYTDVSMNDEALSDDERAYISEYLDAMLDTKDQNEKGNTVTHQHQADCVVFLECPDGTETISVVVNGCFLNSAEGNCEICGSCGIELSKHKQSLRGHSSSV